MAPEPTYFTTTLGQAASLGLQQPHKTINDLIDALAESSPNKPAVGFALPSQKRPQILDFAHIRQATSNLANNLYDEYPHLRSKQATVALLCPSTIEFLLVWLALIRLGHSVLLIAPQCAPSAIESLCNQCSVDLLFYDDSYAELAKQASKLSAEAERPLQAAKLPFDDASILELTDKEAKPVRGFQVSKTDLAYLHHTSGTSTGIPKPIPQSHNAAVGVLPAIPSGHHYATFTTTPLYHGGVADLFRAWSSSALIWLFPGKALPITAANIVKCLDIARDESAEDSTIPPIKYFSSVPYVLQLLESSDTGMQYLKGMDLVGVGGAALPTVVGDRLVAQGVNLLSRFGSAECGFLLSSHRDYANDKEWQFLRRSEDQKYLKMVPQDDSLCELVVLDGWPHLAKRNRDGSFATSDLFEKHKTLSEAYRYHSRADSQLTLITGKKFDPAPLEAEIATSDVVEDVVIFGNGQPYAGALIFRSAKAASSTNEDLIADIWPDVEKLNNGSQEHAKISRAMLIAMPVLDHPLEKSSKGTLLRRQAEERFKTEIDAAYTDTKGDEDTVADEDLPNAIRDIITSVSSRSLVLEDNTDLFSAGIDSVAGMQIRSRLRSLVSSKNELPMTIVEDCGSIGELAKYVEKQRSGSTVETGYIDESEFMHELVKKHTKFVDRKPTTTPISDGEVIVLTGATGSLGAHMLDQYRKKSSVTRIYCLVRGADAHASRERVAKSLSQRRLSSLEAADSKVVVLQVKLGEPDLGLDNETYERLATEATTIVHVAWTVNFRMRLKSFEKENIGGLKHLLDLTLSSPRKVKPAFGFCSSVASVMAFQGKSVPESIVDNSNAATSLGYSRSKWVAEQICASADRMTTLHGRIAVFRVGQLAGDTRHGVWNASEAWPIMLSSSMKTGVLPSLDREVLQWLPVDIAATSLIQGMEYLTNGNSQELQVFHVVNDEKTPSWMDMIAWLRARGVSTVAPSEWVEQISTFAEKNPAHPAGKLVSHWKEAYGSDATRFIEESTTFDMENTKDKIPVLRQIQPIGEDYFWKLWRWIEEGM